MDFKTQFPLGEVGHSVELAGAIYRGRNATYYLYLPDADDDKTAIALQPRMTTDDWNALIRQSDLVETEVLQKAKDGSIVKVIARKCERQVAAQVSWDVFRRDGFRCRYCGRGDASLTVDHLVLWEEGGPSTMENMVAVCKRCNKLRGRMQFADWLESDAFARVSEALITTAERTTLGELCNTLHLIPRFQNVRSR